MPAGQLSDLGAQCDNAGDDARLAGSSHPDISVSTLIKRLENVNVLVDTNARPHWLQETCDLAATQLQALSKLAFRPAPIEPASIRNQALEEAAKLFDKHSPTSAAAIRALKDKP